mmetsp:Transcript_5614/g.17670  ORF Transcript_5614/g.17670 Transcript_5614/m.17670 type:complete len:87 (+) Transcript_5614:2315-2575(+)
MLLTGVPTFACCGERTGDRSPAAARRAQAIDPGDERQADCTRRGTPALVLAGPQTGADSREPIETADQSGRAVRGASLLKSEYSES